MRFAASGAPSHKAEQIDTGTKVILFEMECALTASHTKIKHSQERVYRMISPRSRLAWLRGFPE